MNKVYINQMLTKLRLTEGEQLPKDILDAEGITPDEDIDEVSTSAGAGAYQTPYAFGKADDDTIEAMGYKKVKKKNANESRFMQISKELHLNEASYKDYKNDITNTPQQKVNKAIHEVSKKMIEIERLVNQNLKLKKEMRVNNNEFWKSTQGRMYKISERLIRIANQLKELNS
jgi:hypothetical protein